MNLVHLYLIGLSTLAFVANSHGEVKELTNTEMTEAYILDGSIIVKQRVREQKKTKPLNANIKLGPGEPAITEAQSVKELDRQANSQILYDQELIQKQGAQQLQQFEQASNSRVFIAPPLNSAAQAQQAHAESLVRDGLNLADNAQITPEIMGQYLSTFAGQTTGNPLTAQQAMTANGFQFIIPNPGGEIQSGIYSSGDNSINLEANNTQLIFNLLFPQNP